MTEEAELYLKKELEISKLRLESLEESTNLSEVAKTRLLDIEKRFQELNFSTIEVNDLSDAMTAVRLYRSSRKDFYLLYFDKKTKDFVSNFTEYSKKILSESCLDKKNNIAKKVIKKQGIILSADKIILTIKQKFLDKNLELNDLIFVDFFKEYSNEIFSLYNQSIKDIYQKNKQISNKQLKENYLEDIISVERENKGSLYFERIIFHGKKVGGIVLPIKHLGRETAWLCYKKIIIDNIDYSDLFSYSLKNINLEGSYYKALILKDKEELEKNSDLKMKNSLLMNLLYKNSLSKKDLQKVKIDMEKSILWMPSSRTEDQNIKEAWNLFLNDIVKLNKE